MKRPCQLLIVFTRNDEIGILLIHCQMLNNKRYLQLPFRTFNCDLGTRDRNFNTLRYDYRCISYTRHFKTLP